MDATRQQIIAELYSRFYGYIYSICLRIIKNREDAEDFTQDIFIVLAEKYDQYRHEAELSTYIYRVSVNRVLMHFRKKSTRTELLTADGNLPDDGYRGDHGKILNKLIVRELIDMLAPGHKQTILLHDIEGYEHHEIGALTGRSEGNSKSQLFKARRNLKTLLNGEKLRKAGMRPSNRK